MLIWNLWFWALLCLVTQSRPILCDPMNCSLPGSFVHVDSPGKNTGVGCHALLQGLFPNPGIKPRSPALQVILCRLNHQGSSSELCNVTLFLLLLSHVWLFVTPWTVACHVPLSMGFPRQEYWLPFPSSGDLPDPGIKAESLASSALADGFFTTKSPGKPYSFPTWG